MNENKKKVKLNKIFVKFLYRLVQGSDFRKQKQKKEKAIRTTNNFLCVPLRVLDEKLKKAIGERFGLAGGLVRKK